MASTPAIELAEGILDDCLRYGTWSARALDALIERALDEGDTFVSAAATRALFTVLIERLADLFEPALCQVYARLFSRVIARAIPEYDAEDLALRYRRVSQPRRFVGGEINRVFVLSRVTLGADIAVTSVALAAMKERFPDAEICFVGPPKNAELFTGDPRISSIPIGYTRAGTLRERLLAAFELRSILDEKGTLVVDPDSRLTQLGLIPVCDDSRYYFFESRAFGGTAEGSLSSLASLWLGETFGVTNPRPFVAPAYKPSSAEICVSWGVGENEDKRIDEPFEAAVLQALVATGASVSLDFGAGAAEAERVARLRDEVNSPDLHLHQGSYASFANQIMQSQLYVGYDSVGQHVAAATGIPLISIFAGFPSRRMLSRWKPTGDNATVIPVEKNERAGVTTKVLQSIAEFRDRSLLGPGADH